MSNLKLLDETADSWKRAGKDSTFVRSQLEQISKDKAAVNEVLAKYFPPVDAPKNGHSTPSDLETVARVESPSAPVETTKVPMGRFESIARAAIARGENRVLPIVIGEKNPAIPWVNAEPPMNDIDTMSSTEWPKHVEKWVGWLAEQYPELNCCVVAKPDEFIFIDCDTYREFVAGYENYAKQPFPKTYTTSARDNRVQIHFHQTDATRAWKNVNQFQSGLIDLSVRQNNLYVLAEGSQHPTGSIYTCVVHAPIIPMPDMMVEYIRQLEADAKKTAKASGSADGTPRNEANKIPHGHMHPWLVSQAGKLRANGCRPEEIESILLRRAHEECQEPIDENKVIQIARSMGNYEPGSPSVPIRLSGETANNDDGPDVVVENGITYAIIPYDKGFRRVALDTSVGCARPVFPYCTMYGTSIYENLVQPAAENSSKHAEFIFMPAVQIMLNYLSNKISIPFQKTNLNLFLGLISPYGKFFKSTSCELAQDYMKAVGIFDSQLAEAKKNAGAKVLSAQAGSPEGFGLAMKEFGGIHPHAIMYNDELGKLVAKVGIENSSFASDMLSWYGSGEVGNLVKSTKLSYSFAAGSYTFGWLWCTTDRNFNTYWPKLAGKGSGIGDRMFFVVSQEQPRPATAKYADPSFEGAKKTMELITQAMTRGKFVIDDPLFDFHQKGLDDPRSLDLMMKLALYFAVDLGTTLDEDCFERARMLVDYRNQAARFLEPIEADNAEGRLMKEILRELKQNGGRMPYRDLCRNLEYNRHGRLWGIAYDLLEEHHEIIEFNERRTGGKRKTRMVGKVDLDLFEE